MSKKLAREQLYVVTGVVVLVVVLIAAVSTVLWLKQDEKSETGDNAPDITAQQSAAEKLDLGVDEARATELKNLIAGEADTQKKAELLIELSILHLNRGDYSGALTLGLEVEGLVKTAQTAGLLGDIYYAQEQYSKAAQQYGTAMTRSEKSGPNERSPYNEYVILKKKAEDAQ